MQRPIDVLALLLTISAVVLGTQPAAAQPGQERKQARQRLAEMDSNGDGTISRQEWRGSLQSFRVHDWNRDGVLSGNELRDAARQAQGDQLEDFDTVDSMNDWSASRFTTLDRNRDGRIARAEWPYDVDSFSRIDRDRNNIVSRTEFLDTAYDHAVVQRTKLHMNLLGNVGEI